MAGENKGHLEYDDDEDDDGIALETWAKYNIVPYNAGESCLRRDDDRDVRACDTEHKTRRC